MPTSDALLTFGCAARRDPGASVGPTGRHRCRPTVEGAAWTIGQAGSRRVGYRACTPAVMMGRPWPGRVAPPAGVAADGVVTVDASGQKSLPVVYRRRAGRRSLPDGRT